MSPPRSFLGPGMPCTISWLTETQVAAGKGSVPGTRWPLKSCSAPREAMTPSTTSSISAVVTPAPTTAAAASWASRTIEPAVRISSISAGVFVVCGTRPRNRLTVPVCGPAVREPQVA